MDQATSTSGNLKKTILGKFTWKAFFFGTISFVLAEQAILYFSIPTMGVLFIGACWGILVNELEDYFYEL